MNVAHRAITLAWIEEGILRGRCVVPADLALNVWTGLGIDDPTVNLDRFLFKLISERVKRLASRQELLPGRSFAAVVFLIVVRAISFAAAGIEPTPVVFDVELDSTQLDDVTSVELVVLNEKTLM